MARRNQPYLPLYVDDFTSDEKLRLCSPATVGVYIHLMCLMHKSERYGVVSLNQMFKQSTEQIFCFANQLSKYMPFSVAEIAPALKQLLDTDVIQMRGEILSQRRMVKDGELSETRAHAGKSGGTKTQSKKPKLDSQFAKAKEQSNTGLELDMELKVESGIEKEKEVKEKKPKLELIFPFDSENFMRVWEVLKTQPKWKKKTPEALQAALKQISEFSNRQESIAIKIMEASIAGGWQGVFEYKQNNGQQKTTGNSSQLDVATEAIRLSRERNQQS